MNVYFTRARSYVDKPIATYRINAQGGIDSLTVVFSMHSNFPCLFYLCKKCA